MIVYWLIYLLIFGVFVIGSVLLLSFLRRAPVIHTVASGVLAAAYFVIYSLQADIGSSVGSFRVFVKPTILVVSVSMTIVGIAILFSGRATGTKRVVSLLATLISAAVCVLTLVVPFTWSW